MGGLQYLAAQDWKIESGLSREIVSGEDDYFGFVRKGSVKVTRDHRTMKAGYGEVFLLPKGSRSILQNQGKETSHVLLIRFHCLGNIADATQMHHFRMPRVRNWVRDFLQEERRDDESLSYLLHAHLYAIAAEFTAWLKEPRGADDDLIEYVVQVKQEMVADSRMTLDVEEIARLSGASSAKFYQVFKRYTGLSPLKFVTMTRLQESLRLLANQPTSIKEVAHAVGYPDELYFSRLFKKQLGLSPTDYAAKTKKRVANLAPVFRGDLSALGITPVLELPRSWYDDPEKDPYIRQIEKCRPDLILTAPVSEELYQTLSQIAPVVMIRWKGYSWKERLLQIAGVVGIATVAERWLAQFQMKVENARTHVRSHLGEESFLVVSVYEPFFRVYGLQRIKVSDLFYGELGVTPPAVIEQVAFLDVKTLAEAAALDCGNVLFLVPETLSEESVVHLEEEWLRCKRDKRRKRCLFIRHEDPLLYNAAFYESLVDQFVTQLITSR